LNKKAETDGIPLPADVSLFLASHVHSNVRILEGSLLRLKAFSEMAHESISIDMCRHLLKDIVEDQQTFISSEEIIKAVSRYFKIRTTDIKSPKRAKDIAIARQVAMYLCREMTAESFPEIGTHFGGKDHSTVIHAVNKIAGLVLNDSSLQKDIQLIRRSLS
jgi:chromosomal replication initiator protein